MWTSVRFFRSATPASRLPIAVPGGAGAPARRSSTRSCTPITTDAATSRRATTSAALAIPGILRRSGRRDFDRDAVHDRVAGWDVHQLAGREQVVVDAGVPGRDAEPRSRPVVTPSMRQAD